MAWCLIAFDRVDPDGSVCRHCTVYHFENNIEIPLVKRDRATCERSLLTANASGATQNLFGTMQLPLFLPNETSSNHDFMQNLAAFLLTRGDFSFFGAVGPGDAAVFSPLSGSRWFAEYDYDYGTPMGGMRIDGSGVYSREWTRVTVRLDCNTFEARFDWKGSGQPLKTDDGAVIRIHVASAKATMTTADGSISHPFSSLHAAVDAVRELKGAHNGTLPSPVEVLLEPETHFLTEPILIDASAAGEKGGHTVTFKPRNASAGSVISGGVEIPTSSWTKYSDWALTKNTNVWRAPLPAGIIDDGSLLQMWHGQGPITKAPPNTWHRMKLAASPMLKYEHATPTYIKFKPGQVLANYSNLDRVHLVTYESWTASIHRIASINADNRTVHMNTTFDSQWANGASGSRFYVENAGEYLNGAGKEHTKMPLVFLHVPNKLTRQTPDRTKKTETRRGGGVLRCRDLLDRSCRGLRISQRVFLSSHRLLRQA